MWQKAFEKYGGDHFTIVGLALDSEGIPPAKRYYDEFKVTFPATVDPNYATKFTAVPYTFFIDEHGVVRSLVRGKTGWEKLIKPKEQLRPVTEAIRKQWTPSGQRLHPETLAALAEKNQAVPTNLEYSVALGSRYVDLGKLEEARAILKKTIAAYDPLKVARGSDPEKTKALSQAYFQLSRASKGDRDAEVKNATLSFYLQPSIGYGKQIARIIAPEKFDGRPKGDFDNRFREATLRRLTEERRRWLAGKM